MEIRLSVAFSLFSKGRVRFCLIRYGVKIELEIFMIGLSIYIRIISVFFISWYCIIGTSISPVFNIEANTLFEQHVQSVHLNKLKGSQFGLFILPRLMGNPYFAVIA